jgi:hypothetical protein
MNGLVEDFERYRFTELTPSCRRPVIVRLPLRVKSPLSAAVP